MCVAAAILHMQAHAARARAKENDDGKARAETALTLHSRSLVDYGGGASIPAGRRAYMQRSVKYA